jgi:3-methyl-2-oxobutanoate hydroxymethyltransferase
MKKLYSWGGKFVERNLTISDLISNKGNKQFIQTTATNSKESSAAREAGIDMLLCKSPHIKTVREGAPDIFLTATIDLALFPSQDDVLREAFNCMKDGADQIYTARGPHVIEYLSREEIPVMCHLGLVPRKSAWKGGLRAVGRNAKEAYDLFKNFKTMESAGATSVECEIIHNQIMKEIYQRTSLLISSLGSGTYADIIYLFQNDVCGELENIPRHARSFGNVLKLEKEIYKERINSLSRFKKAVISKDYPNNQEIVQVDELELDKFLKLIS